ncbi:membrane protein [Longimycelium tulufanense]|uniref:Membrane protein n=1 Tax=Longimycelium tulufanense TaxID=907463 RepID=A0A8J3FXW7_9PSEU|nr:metal-dependent hydrolase [Longimycelium tulufanense]GGM77230.1 membrane protein [Longimycelium tulufanense]
MLGRTHALTGWCAGLAVAPLVGLHGLVEAVPFAAITAGYALLPDLDHPHARASRLLGSVTAVLSNGLRALSAAVYRRTRGPGDSGDSDGEHRHLSHTLAFAGTVGTGTAVGTQLAGTWGLLVVLAVGTLLAVDSLGDWVGWGLAGTLLLGVPTAAWGQHGDWGTVLLQGLEGTTAWAGLAVGLGCAVHSLGDACTRSGCPLLWPAPIRGARWYRVGLPRAWRFRTGGDMEMVVLFPVFVVAGVLLVPGVWPVATSTVAAMFNSGTDRTSIMTIFSPVSAFDDTDWTITRDS